MINRIWFKSWFNYDYNCKCSIREPVIDRGPVIDHFLVIVSLFNRNICSNSFSCPDFMYLILPKKSK